MDFLTFLLFELHNVFSDVAKDYIKIWSFLLDSSCFKHCFPWISSEEVKTLLNHSILYLISMF